MIQNIDGAVFWFEYTAASIFNYYNILSWLFRVKNVCCNRVRKKLFEYRGFVLFRVGVIGKEGYITDQM